MTMLKVSLIFRFLLIAWVTPTYAEECPIPSTFVEADRPVVSLQLKSDESIEPHIGTSREYEMKMDFPQGCDREVKIEITSMFPGAVRPCRETHSYIQGDLLWEDIVVSIDPVFACRADCKKYTEAECEAYTWSRRIINETIYNWCQFWNNTGPVERWFGVVSGYIDCNMEYDYNSRNEDTYINYFGPSSIHIYDTEYSDAEAKKQEKRVAKPYYPNVDHQLATEFVTDKTSLEVNYKGLLIQSVHALTDPQSWHTKIDLSLTTGALIDDDLLFVSTEAVPLQNWERDYQYNFMDSFKLIPKVDFRTDAPNTWKAARGETKMVKVEIGSYHIGHTLKFNIFPRDNNDGVFCIGRPVVKMLGAYRINPLDFWMYESKGSTELENCESTEWNLKYENVLHDMKNWQTWDFTGDIDMPDEEDSVMFLVPITFMGKKRNENLIETRIKIEVWLDYIAGYTHLMNVVEDETAVVEANVSPTVLKNECEDGCSIPVDGLISFNVLFSVPQGVANFYLKAVCKNTGLSPENIELTPGPLFGYIPSSRQAGSYARNEILYLNYGNVFNGEENNTMEALVTISAGEAVVSGNVSTAGTTADCFIGFHLGDLRVPFSLNITEKKWSDGLPPLPALTVSTMQNLTTLARGELLPIEIELEFPYDFVYRDFVLSIAAKEWPVGEMLKLWDLKTTYKGAGLVCKGSGPTSHSFWLPTRIIQFQRSMCSVNRPKNHRYNNRLRLRALIENFAYFIGSSDDVIIEVSISSRDHSAVTKTISFIPQSTYGEINKLYLYPGEEQCYETQMRMTSGISYCFVDIGMQQVARRDFCWAIHADLMEIHNRHDWHFMEDIMLWIRNDVALGGEIRLNTETGSSELVWENSGKKFDIGDGHRIPVLPEYGDPLPYPSQGALRLISRHIHAGKDGVPQLIAFGKILESDLELKFLCRNSRPGHDYLSRRHFSSYIADTSEYLTNFSSTLEGGQIGLHTYNLKLPKRFGSLARLVITLDPKLKICTIRPLHVGSAYPTFPTSLTYGAKVYNSTSLTYESPYRAVVFMDHLANLGEGPVVNSKMRDEHSIEIGVFFEVLPGASFASTTIEIVTNFQIYTQTALEWKHNIKTRVITVSSDLNVEFNTDTKLAINFTTEDGTLDLIKGTCKKLQFTITTTKPLYVWPVIQNLGFDTGSHVTWCGFAPAKVGENFPCYDASSAINTTLPCDAADPLCTFKDASGTILFWRSFWLPPVKLINYEYVADSEASQLMFEVSVRAGHSIAPGTQVPLKFSLCGIPADLMQIQTPPPACTANFRDKEFFLTVRDSNETLLANMSSPALGVLHSDIQKIHQLFLQPRISACDEGNKGNNATLRVRERAWLCLEVRFPYRTKYHTKLTISSEVIDGVSLLHFLDVRFAKGTMSNAVLGVLDHMDVRSVYNVQFQANSTISFMQKDQVFIDFGLLENPGYMSNVAAHRPEHSFFQIEVQVELADHQASTHEKTTLVTWEMYIGEKYLKSYSDIFISRNETMLDRVEGFRPHIHIEMFNDQPSSDPYPSSGNLSISTLIYHHDNSRGEGRPSTVRFQLDAYSSIDLASYRSNYTNTSLTASYMDTQRMAGSAQFHFGRGISFPDIIELNFTVIVDVTKRRRLERNPENLTIVTSSVCSPAKFEGFPAMTSTTCSPNNVLILPIETKKCDLLLPIENPDCQIQSNYILSTASSDSAANAIDNATSWKSPIRTGSRWEYYVQFDFQSLVKVTKIIISSPIITRYPVKIRIDYGLTQTSFVRGETVFQKFDKSLGMTKHVVGRFVRLVVVEGSPGSDDSKPIAIHQAQFRGCRPQVFEDNDPRNVNQTFPPREGKVEWCAVKKEIFANSSHSYRQYAVDQMNGNIVYLCDVNQYRTRTTCYSALESGRSWRALPQYVTTILGFSKEKGRVFMTDSSQQSLMSSLDGGRVDVSNLTLTTLTSLPGWIPAVMVPADSRNNLLKGAHNWPGSLVTANFRGLALGGKDILNWESCCLPAE